MSVPHAQNDLTAIIEADRAHVWHHLSQHKPYETADPRIIVRGEGTRVWDQHGKEHLDGVSGGVWTVNVGYGRKRSGSKQLCCWPNWRMPRRTARNTQPSPWRRPIA